MLATMPYVYQYQGTNREDSVAPALVQTKVTQSNCQIQKTLLH